MTHVITYMLAEPNAPLYSHVMSERMPHSPEASGAAFIKTLDTLFEAAICGAFEGGNEDLLKDLGLAVSYDFDKNEVDKDTLCIANWNTQDIIRIVRAERDVDISSGLSHSVRFQISQADMLDRNLHLPFRISDQDIGVQRLYYAVTDSGILVPWIAVENGEEMHTIFSPEIEDCIENHDSSMMSWLNLIEARTLLDLYAETDPLASLSI